MEAHLLSQIFHQGIIYTAWYKQKYNLTPLDIFPKKIKCYEWYTVHIWIHNPSPFLPIEIFESNLLRIKVMKGLKKKTFKFTLHTIFSDLPHVKAHSDTTL